MALLSRECLHIFRLHLALPKNTGIALRGLPPSISSFLSHVRLTVSDSTVDKNLISWI